MKNEFRAESRPFRISYALLTLSCPEVPPFLFLGTLVSIRCRTVVICSDSKHIAAVPSPSACRPRDSEGTSAAHLRLIQPLRPLLPVLLLYSLISVRGLSSPSLRLWIDGNRDLLSCQYRATISSARLAIEFRGRSVRSLQSTAPCRSSDPRVFLPPKISPEVFRAAQ